jgi:cell division septal protein FtsQ
LGLIVSALTVCLLSWGLLRSSLFLVKQVEVDASERPGPGEIRSMSGILPGTNLLRLDTEEVSRRVEAHPWIRHATVVKRLPDQVLITITETQPAVIVGIQGRLYYLDGDGEFLDLVPPGASLDFPIISGLEQDVDEARRCGKGRDIQQALSLLDRLQRFPALGRVSEIHVDRSRGLSFVLEGFPVPVRVGWSGFSTKIGRFEGVLPLLISHFDSIARVDLRFSGQIVVQERVGDRLPFPKENRAGTLAGSSRSFHPMT